MDEQKHPKKVKVRLKVNLKRDRRGGIIPRGTIFHDRLINLPPNIKECVKSKNTKILEFLDDVETVVEFKEPVVSNMESTTIRPLEAPSKREEIKTYDSKGVSHEADMVITPPSKPKPEPKKPVKPKKTQLKKRDE